MQPDDSFRSIRGPSSAELKVKGSRFIAEAFPVSSETEAEDRIDAIRRREHGATHHCYAYLIGPESEHFRYNDDGEPSGTAGIPILRQIQALGWTNVLVVVTRYFGGTKLGTGGLSRAYGEAAAMVLDASKSIEHVISEPVNVSFDYGDTNPAMHVIEKYEGEIVDSEYSDRTRLKVAVPRSKVHAFRDAFVDALGGRGEVRVAEEG